MEAREIREKFGIKHILSQGSARPTTLDVQLMQVVATSEIAAQLAEIKEELQRPARRAATEREVRNG